MGRILSQSCDLDEVYPLGYSTGVLLLSTSHTTWCVCVCPRSETVYGMCTHVGTLHLDVCMEMYPACMCLCVVWACVYTHCMCVYVCSMIMYVPERCMCERMCHPLCFFAFQLTSLYMYGKTIVYSKNKLRSRETKLLHFFDVEEGSMPGLLRDSLNHKMLKCIIKQR